MSHNYTDLLKVAYEIEGLIALQAQRGDDAITTVDEMIADKIAILAREFGIEDDMPESGHNTENEPVIPIVEENSENEPDTHVSSVNPPAEDADETAEADEAADDEAIAESALSEETGDADVSPVIEPVSAPVPDMSITLDEKLARERAQDIFKAFTLNDKFRFRRELFRGSQDEFDDALNIISQMSTIEEAEEYIYNDLCWDPENEDVKAFMDIVTKHF